MVDASNGFVLYELKGEGLQILTCVRLFEFNHLMLFFLLDQVVLLLSLFVGFILHIYF